MTDEHQHEWSALSAHFGPYRDRDSHYHVCFRDGCGAMLVGKGRECDGKMKSHREDK